MARFAFALAALIAFAALAGSAPIGASGPADLLDVVQVNGTSSSGTAAAIVPVAWNGTSGTVGATFATLPTADSGSQHGLVESGSASSDSQLSLSTDGRYLTLGGYDAPLGTAKVGSAAGVKRTLARIDAAGDIDTSTALTDAFAGSNLRSVATTDGTQFWAGGDGTGIKSGQPLQNIAVVNAALGTSTSTAVETATKQSVDVALGGGAVFFTQKAGSAAAGVWETNGGTTALIAPEVDPYGLVVLHTGPTGSAPDTIYVADADLADNKTGPAGGVYKYSFNGTAWVADGSVLGTNLAGLAGRVEPDGSVQLYATTWDGGTGGNQVVTLTDSSGFGGTIGGSFSTVATAPTGVVYRGIAFAPAGQQLGVAPPTVTLSQTAESRAIGETSYPDSFTVNVGDSVYTPDQLSVTATHAAHGTAADPVTGLTVSGSGATRTVTVSSADTVGLADITVTVTTPDGRHGSAATPFEYGVSAAAPDATGNWLENFSNGSTEQDVGGGCFIVGDDNLNALAMYQAGVSGPPVTTWNFDSLMGVADSSQLDIEASARVGNTIYWFGSESNNSEGEVKAQRSYVYATTISGDGCATTLSFAGFYKNLRNDFLNSSFASTYDFADGQQGIPKRVDGFNIEGAEFAPDNSTIYLGFRAPIVPTSNRTQALVVPLTNLASLMSSSGNTGSADFGTPFQWNLTPAGYQNPLGDTSALGVREIRKNADNQYVIIAGSYEEVPAAPNGGAEFLYTWDGNPADQPILTNTVLPTTDDGSWEGLVSLPDPLVDGDAVRFVADDGDDDFYGTGDEAKDLDPGLQRELTDVFAVALPAQTVTITSSPASPAYATTTYTLAATGGPTGNPIAFSSETQNVCTVAGNVVSLLAAGSCVVDADQAGNFQYGAGHASQTITVAAVPPPVVTPVVTGTLGNAGWYTSNVAVSWNISSPLTATSCAPTTLTADTAGTTVSCTSTNAGGSTTGSVTVEIDKTAPKITYSGNAGSYSLLANVAITCAASDPTPGSGLASTTCANVNAPAWTFGPGTTTLSATATDIAGNTGTGSTSFTVTVTPTTLCTLASQFVQQSTNYQRLNPLQKLGVNVLVSVACNFVTQLTPKASPAAKAALLKTFDAAVNGLASSGWLTPAQAATLTRFAGAL